MIHKLSSTDIKDEIDKIHDRVWSNPLKVCELVHYYTGTFCFPLGPEFGCGSAMELSAGASFTLSSEFEKGGFKVGASATFTVSAAWSHESEKCEWCAPVVCFPNSTLEVWQCEHFLDWFSWKSEFVRFTPGRAQIFPNCKQDNKKCGCKEDDSHSMVPSGMGGFFARLGDEQTTVVIRTKEIRKRTGDQRTDPAEDLKQAAMHIESFSEAPGLEGCRMNDTILIALPGGREVVLSGPKAVRNELALLSLEHCQIGPPAVLVQRERLIPVLAVGQAVSGAKARIRLIKREPQKSEVILDESGLTQVGRLTTIWKELQLPAGKLKPGESANLVVDLTDERGVVVSSLCERVLMPHKVPEDITTQGVKPPATGRRGRDAT